MTLPFTLPDWLPWWVPLVLLLPALLYALAFLFMPFSVIGVKSRLEVIEARLDEIQNEIRHLALRLPAAAREADFDEIYTPRSTDRRTADPPIVVRPPIPPAAHELHDGPQEDRPAPPAHARPVRRAEPPVRSARSEPRLDWPR
ncbi:MAG: hypothetical protein AB7F35_17880 [Acetobacteraceae bacterium]